MQVDLYNLSPALQLMGVGLLVAGLPLFWTWRQHRTAGPARRLKALTVLTLILTFELVLVGAFTRLTDSGLGCPDWPGCYGSATPLGAHHDIAQAQAAMPTGPVTHGKAWIEMVHRYMATGVGVLIIALCALTWRQWWRDRRLAVHPGWPMLSLVWVCLQGAFGALTVTMKLFPLIVSLHLLLAIGLLALLVMQAVRYEGWRSVVIPRGLRWALVAAWLLLWLQIALGAWVSTNYAVLACSDFPTCQGQWWPEMNGLGFRLWRELGLGSDGQPLPFAALASIHYIHRCMAWVVLAVLLGVGWRLRLQPGLVRPAQALLALSVLQFFTGLSNVVLDWPLFSAVLHTGGAAALMMTLTWALSLSTTSVASQLFMDSRPVA
jgi:cytochrome c oxidase assembly protein subunit 15